MTSCHDSISWCFGPLPELRIAQAVAKQALRLGAREVHESARSHAKPLADRIDEMPVPFEGKSFDVQADEPGQHRVEPERVARQRRDAEPGYDGLPDRLVGTELHAYGRGQPMAREQPQNDHAGFRARLAYQ